MQQRQLAAIAAGLVMLLIAGLTERGRADQDDPRLDGLFQRLQHTPDAAEAQVSSSRSGRSGSNPKMPRSTD